MQPRVGHINFLNCQPLTYSLLECGYAKGLSLTMEVPSILNKAMKNGQLDVSPMSFFAFAQMSNRLLLLPNLGIVADGSVLSIILASKRPIEELDGQKVLLTAQSATSVNLLKIILRHAYGESPHYQTEKLDPLKALAGDETAALFIGDDALYLHHHRRQGVYYYDLGNEWKKMTKMPMVYAVWAVTKQFAEAYPDELKMVYGRLRGGFDHGNENINNVADMVKGKASFSKEQLLEYFSVITYDVTEKHLKALKMFSSMAYENGLLTALPEMRMADL